MNHLVGVLSHGRSDNEYQIGPLNKQKLRYQLQPLCFSMFQRRESVPMGDTAPVRDFCVYVNTSFYIHVDACK